jgi:uncharacterized membrane protein
MYCSNCGAEVTGAFCGKCGAPAPGQAAPPASGQTTGAEGLSENVAGALCYVLGLITGILFLALAPHNQNPRIRFHAWQSIFFNIAIIVLIVVETVISTVLPLALLVIFGLLQVLISLGILGVWLFLMWKTFQGSTVSLPVIGDLAKKQAGA